LDEAAVILDQPALHEVGVHFRAAASAWDDLTAALLPDSVPLFAETRALMDRSYALFMQDAVGTLDERRANRTRLAALEAEAVGNFPLSDAEAAHLRANLRERVMAIHDVEKIAFDALIQVVGDL